MAIIRRGSNKDFLLRDCLSWKGQNNGWNTGLPHFAYFQQKCVKNKNPPVFNVDNPRAV